MTRPAKFLFSLGLSLPTLLVSTVCLLAVGLIQSDQPPIHMADSSGWRMTEFGWQDTTTWLVDGFAPTPILETVHPAIFALAVLFLAIGVMVWASNEWDFARLFEDED